MWLFRLSYYDAANLATAMICGIVSFIPVVAITSRYDQGIRFAVLLFVWLNVLLVLLAAGPKASDTARRRWSLACCNTLFAVYGPPVVFNIDVFWSEALDFWQARVIESLTYPGYVIIEIPWKVVERRDGGLDSIGWVMFAGLLSILVTVGTTWAVAKRPHWRWGLPFVCVLYICAHMVSACLPTGGGW
jgi:hypothetical protein